MSAPTQLVIDGLRRGSSEIVATRSDPLYGVHAYHTKVPPSALVELIEEHTDPGDLVADVFCGSGMTGVAAALTGRRAFLNDLSPAAVHIAANYTTPCVPAEFEAAVQRVLERVGTEVAALYGTEHAGAAATVEYVVWSDVRSCPKCAMPLLLWDYRHTGLRALACPECEYEGPKIEFSVVGERAVEANLSTPGERTRIIRPAEEADLGLDAVPASMPWTPNAAFGGDRPMWRRGHDDLDIRTVADFYSRRNLAAMSLLWDAASAEPNGRLRSALRFSLTAIANRASRRYQWNAKRPTNVLGGTLYVSSLRYEWNVLSLWRRKTAAVLRLFRDNAMPPGAVEVHQGSAAALPLGKASVDYVVTDPPFGAHIVYSDVSLLWEAWLDEYTNRHDEAIVVAGGDHAKSVSDYERLLLGAFREIHRILKPGGRATVIFQATDPDVWAAIQHAATGAGFELLDATTLDKGQPSFKQIKGRSGERSAAMDLILTFGRRSDASPSRIEESLTPVQAAQKALETANGVGTAVPIGKLYASVNARLLASGAERITTYEELLAILREHFNETAAGWALG